MESSTGDGKSVLRPTEEAIIGFRIAVAEFEKATQILRRAYELAESETERRQLEDEIKRYRIRLSGLQP